MTDQPDMIKTELNRMLDRRIQGLQEARDQMIDDVNKCGAAYAMKWAEKKVRLEMFGRVAQEAKAKFEADGLDAVCDWLLERALDNIGYVIPTNSLGDVCETLYRAQGFADLAKEVIGFRRWAAKQETK